MARLLIHVEGQTEETFVNEVLRDHLLNKRFERVDARIFGNARLKRRRGIARTYWTRRPLKVGKAIFFRALLTPCKWAGDYLRTDVLW